MNDQTSQTPTQNQAAAPAAAFDPAAAARAQLERLQQQAASLASQAGQTAQTPPVPPAHPAAAQAPMTPAASASASAWGSDGSEGQELETHAPRLRLRPFPRTESWPVTLVAAKFEPAYTFKFRDKQTGLETSTVGEGWWLIFGGIADGQPCFVMPGWAYKVGGPRSNYGKIFRAFTGFDPAPGRSKPSCMLGKHALMQVEATERISQRNTRYIANKIIGFSPLPGLLASAATPREKLLPYFEAMVAASVSGGAPVPQPGQRPNFAPTPAPTPAPSAAIPPDDIPF